MTTQNTHGEDSLWKRVAAVIKRDWNTIPNLLSYFRLLLIPVFIWLYVGEGNYEAAAVTVIISGLSDVLDGFIARHFNMVSDFGKVLDPAADKLTQVAMFICLSVRYKLALVLVCIIVVKEITMFILGMVVFKKAGDVHSARWFGKLATFIVIATSFILIIFTKIDPAIANGLLVLSLSVVSFSFVMYGIYYLEMLRGIAGK